MNGSLGGINSRKHSTNTTSAVYSHSSAISVHVRTNPNLAGILSVAVSSKSGGVMHCYTNLTSFFKDSYDLVLEASNLKLLQEYLLIVVFQNRL